MKNEQQDQEFFFGVLLLFNLDPFFCRSFIMFLLFPLFGFCVVTEEQTEYSVVSLQPVYQRLSTFRVCFTLVYVEYQLLSNNILRYFLYVVFSSRYVCISLMSLYSHGMRG